MKSIIIFAVFNAFLGFSIKAQEKKQTTLSDFSTLTYHVNEQKQLDGAYTISNKDQKIWLRGNYKSNERVGNWYCFNSDGKVFLRYNYSLDKLLMLDTNAIKNVEIKILDQDDEVKRSASIPLPICGMDQYVSLFANQISNILAGDKAIATVDVPIQIVATINQKGKPSYSLIYTVGQLEMVAPLKIEETKFDLLWLPSIYQGKIISSEFKVNTVFKRKSSEKLRFKWNY